MIFNVLKSVSWVVTLQIVIQYLFLPPFLELAHKHLVRRHIFLLFVCLLWQLWMDLSLSTNQEDVIWRNECKFGAIHFNRKITCFFLRMWMCYQWASSSMLTRTISRGPWLWCCTRYERGWMTYAEPLTSKPLDER